MWESIKNDYYNEETQGYAIDGWKKNEDQGQTLAWVFQHKIVYIDHASRMDEKVQKAIQECQERLEKENVFNKVLEVLTEHHELPIEIKYDVLKRSADWIASGGTLNDSYLKRQLKYLERHLQK